jgi:hypothetical protein
MPKSCVIKNFALQYKTKLTAAAIAEPTNIG